MKLKLINNKIKIKSNIFAKIMFDITQEKLFLFF